MMQRIKSLCWDGKRKYVALPLVLILIPSAAFAAWIFLFGMTGQVRTATVTPTLSGVSATSSSSATCTPSINGNKIHLAISDAFPGGECTIQVLTSRPSNEQDVDMKVQGVEFIESNVVTTKFEPGSCGVVANEYSLGVANTNRFSFTVKISASAAMGTTYPAKASAGISLVPASDYVAANCPTW